MDSLGTKGSIKTVEDELVREVVRGVVINSPQYIGQQLVADDFLVDNHNRFDLLSSRGGSINITNTHGHSQMLDFKAESNQRDITSKSRTADRTNHNFEKCKSLDRRTEGNAIKGVRTGTPCLAKC